MLSWSEVIPDIRSTLFCSIDIIDLAGLLIFATKLIDLGLLAVIFITITWSGKDANTSRP